MNDLSKLFSSSKESLKVDTRTDPFKKKCIESIAIWGDYPIFGTEEEKNTFRWSATVYVLNGNTKGQIKTEKHTTFDSLSRELQSIINDLK